MPPPTGGADNGLLEHAEADLYDEWKRYGSHLEEYASEFFGTLFLVFCVVGAVSLMFGDSSPFPRWMPSASLRLFLTGLLLGGASWLIAITPPGRLSGAHLNPAVSLGFWALGKMHHRDAAGYVTSQMLGAPLGALLGKFVFGSWARQVHSAALHPGLSIGPATAFLAETGGTFALTFLVYTFVSHKPLMRWTPAMATLVVGVLVCIDGNVSGCGMNPARWFGPAVAAMDWRLFWIYLWAPLLGSAFAAGLRRTGFLTHPVPSTGKLFHDARYRSIFRHDLALTTFPEKRT